MTIANELLEDVYLKAPDLSDQAILGYNVGIRPFRKAGIRLEPEYLKNKFIIHNYGYGGSGLTLAWGGASEVISLLEQIKAINSQFASTKVVAVLGAGVTGLTVAYELIRQGYQVNLYADKFSPQLTSDVAAGILSAPALGVDASAAQQGLVSRLLSISIRRLLISADTENPEFSGVKYLKDYRFEVASAADAVSSKFKGIGMDEKIVRVHFDNGIVKVGKQIHELGLDGKLFMEDLYAQAKAKGVLIYQQRFDTVNDIEALSEQIIVNCTSMGSRTLFNDQHFMPIRGHLIYLQAQPGVDYSLHFALLNELDYWVKLYPWSDRLILGGVYEYGNEDCVVDSKVVDKLLLLARACF